jgi:hypothetical protein
MNYSCMGTERALDSPVVFLWTRPSRIRQPTQHAVGTFMTSNKLSLLIIILAIQIFQNKYYGKKMINKTIDLSQKVFPENYLQHDIFW